MNQQPSIIVTTLIGLKRTPGSTQDALDEQFPPDTTRADREQAKVSLEEPTVPRTGTSTPDRLRAADGGHSNRPRRLWLIGAAAAVSLFLLAVWAPWQTDEATAPPESTVADTPRPARVPVEGGTFRMGSSSGRDNEKPPHTVTVAPFEMARTETTVAEYGACVAAGVCSVPSLESAQCNYWKSNREDHPINCVPWHDARTYASWAGGRLPTEAEWEYTARSQGLNQEYPWGDADPDCSLAVMDRDGVPGCGRNGTWPVCSKPKGNSAQGLCDLEGNVGEWVEDDWHSTYRGAPDNGTAWVDEPRPRRRVVRGGSFVHEPEALRAAYRYDFFPDVGSTLAGFRVVWSRSEDEIDSSPER